MTSHPWFHPRNIHATHRQALELMVEILDAAVNDALPEARCRHPLPGPIPGALLGALVRDGAREIALSHAFDNQTLRAAPAPNMALHLVTPGGLLRIRVRKLSDPEQQVPDEDQLELEFPDDYVSNSLFGEVRELALFWAVRGEALYKVVLAAPVGWDDEVSLSTWYGSVEVHAPAVRTLIWPPAQQPSSATATEQDTSDDLDDVIRRQTKPDSNEEEAPGDVG